MFSRSAFVLVVALAGGGAPIAGTPGVADYVLVETTETVSDDLYAAGLVVDVQGVVEGDLVAAASDRIMISGTINGDVMAVAPTVEISGDVMGSVRVVADRVVVAGTVGHDVVVVGRSVSASSTIDQDLWALANSLSVSGSVGRDVAAQTLGNAFVSAEVGRDVDINADVLEVASTATVGGDLRYRGDLELNGNATVVGGANELGPPPVPLRARTLLLAGAATGFLMLLLSGLAAFFAAPSIARAATASAGNWPWALLAGAVVVVAPPAVLGGAVFGLEAVSSDLLGVGLVAVAPFLLLYFALITAMLVVGSVPALSRFGTLLTRGRGSAPAGYLVGLFVAVAVAFIPVVGAWLLLGAWLVGVGSWAIGWRRVRLATPTVG